MNPHYTYLLLDAGTLLFPLLLSFDKRVAFYKTWKHLWLPMLLTGAGFIAWDAAFTRQGVWQFNDAYLLGIRAAGLPLEEWLFFLVVPYACVFIYACLPVYVRPLRSYNVGWKALPVLGFGLIAVAVFYHSRAYTFWAPGLCGVALLSVFLLRKTLKHSFRPQLFLSAWAVCLLPFLAVNGMLTALPVVVYNNAENCGLRIYTIPAEDVFYGMLLVLCVAVGWDYGRSRNTLKQ